MKRALVLISIISLLFLSSCIEINQGIVLNTDGSGKFNMEFVMSPELYTVMKESKPGDMGMFASAMPFRELPLSEKDIKALESKGLRVESSDVKETEDGGLRVRYEIAFDDIKTFAASNAAGEFPFSIESAGDDLAVFRQGSVAETKLGGMNKKKDVQKDPAKERASLAFFKLLFRGLKFRLAVTLPEPIVKSTADNVDGRTAEWVIDLDKMSVDDLLDKSGKPKEYAAYFPAKGLEFSLPVASKTKENKEAGPAGQAMKEKEGKEKTTKSTMEVARARECKVAPSAFFLSSNMNFIDGVAQRPNRSFSLHMQLHCPEGMIETPVSYSYEFTKATTSTGTDIRPKENEESRLSEGSPAYGEDEGMTSYFVPVDIAYPEGGGEAKSMELAGRLLVTRADGLREVRVSPISRWTGGRVDIPELKDYDIRINELKDNSLVLRFSNDTYWALKGVRIEDASGKDLNAEGQWTMYLDGGFREVPYEAKGVKGDSTLVLTFYKGVNVVEVPFEFKDLPLP